MGADSRKISSVRRRTLSPTFGWMIVEAVLNATPGDWFVALPLDWSGGFWRRTAQDNRRLVVFRVLLLADVDGGKAQPANSDVQPA